MPHMFCMNNCFMNNFGAIPSEGVAIAKSTRAEVRLCFIQHYFKFDLMAIDLDKYFE